MLSKLFLGMSLLGAEWVLYFLILLSVLSVSLILERVWFYRKASKGLKDFRNNVRTLTAEGKIQNALREAKDRSEKYARNAKDLETEMICSVLSNAKAGSHVLSEMAQDSVVRAKLNWDKNLSLLATIGSNAPFIGLFGTVLGVIKAFHDLSQQASTGAQMVTAGISEALVATAVGLFVAIPAVVAFNLFQRRVKSALSEAEALKCYLIGKLSTQLSSSD